MLLRPSERVPPGPLAEWLTEAGAELTEVGPTTQDISLVGVAGVVCLGGAMATSDEREYPFLANFRRLLGVAHSRSIPVFAICLGAQLLAEALGGRVRRAERPAVGATLVAKRDIAADDPLFADLPMTPDVIQFHRDEFTLPPGAVLLASAPTGTNQAFRAGPCSYGVQFHLETTSEVLLRWAADDPELASVAGQRAFDPERLVDVHRHIEAAWRPVLHRFVAMATGKPAPASVSRTLPLLS
jgi:GMP synthase-like glutamine amidotransferase